jgi:cytochrome c553
MRGVLLGLAVASFVAACSVAEKQPGSPPVSFAKVSDDPVAHGLRLAAVLGCNGCHAKNLEGNDWSDDLGVLWSANLTRSVVKYSDEELRQMITTGRRPDRDLIGMPSHLFTSLDDGDLTALLAYLRSVPPSGPVHPEPTFTAQYEALRAEGKLPTSVEDVAEHGTEMPPDLGEQFALGRYIVRATCAECHGMQMRGGGPDLPGDKPRPDLRIVASYDPADFTTLMKTGKAAGGREVGLMSEVARGRFANFTDAEREAVRAYLVQLAKRDP